MPDTPESLAEKLREAQKKGGLFWLNVISDHVDNFDMRHDPPSRLDGPTTGQQVRNLNNWEIEHFGKLFQDSGRIEGDVTVEFDNVITDFTFKGALPDGTPVSFSSRTVWKTKDGRIVACYAKQKPDQAVNREAMTRMVEAMNFKVPSGAELGFDR